jgi:predicted short-subunit dehydrogenase-like oxidoreductase (DUF2520 family)
MAPSVNIIGAGLLGKTIGHLLVKYQLVKMGNICNQSKASALCAIQFIGAGQYCASIGELAAADLTFITTSDDAIALTSDALSQNKFIKKGSVVVHCSGAHTSDILISMKKKGCFIASIHPMKSFANPELSIEQYNGTYCAIEGDMEAVQMISPLFNAIGSITYTIDKSKKSLYHAAGVFASNYLVTLSKQALTCMRDAGVEDEMAMRIITHIMRGTVSNLEQTLSPEEALTGPIQRGDVSTILNHINYLTDHEIKYLYSILGKATLHLTNHNQMKKEEIKAALTL